MGVMAALLHRERTGVGQLVDLSMFDAMVSITDVATSLWSLGARERAPGAIVDAFVADDGWFVLQISREHQFERLANVIGRAEWLDDPRFASRQGWVDHLESTIRPAVEAWAKGRPKLEVCNELAAAGLPCGPCNGPEDVLRDPHLAQRDMLVEFPRGDDQPGTYVVPGNPIKMSQAPPAPDRRGPWLGEHTDQVLSDLLGLDHQRIDELRAAGIVG
jgi:crotonobetainyl-CoA:carnitine CoA-transferase CaiB-like acyl-CoA transferase